MSTKKIARTAPKSKPVPHRKELAGVYENVSLVCETLRQMQAELMQIVGSAPQLAHSQSRQASELHRRLVLMEKETLETLNLLEYCGAHLAAGRA